MRYLIRIVSILKQGALFFSVGSKSSLVEFVHVDNLVYAHLLAAKCFVEKKYHIAGKPYFVSDQKPINNFEFLRPLIEGLGHSFPKIQFSVSLMFYLAFFIGE